MEKKKVLGWKNRMKKYFLLKLFLNCFGHWKVSFLTFFNFFRLFVSVLGPKVEKMLVFCSKINEISNRSIHVGMSRNRKNLNFCFFLVGLQFLGLWTRRNPQKNVLGSENSRKSIFAAAVCWIFMPKSWKLMYFWWFPRHHDYFEARGGWCTGAQESKKSKIAKNGLKRTQTIIEVHIKGFWVGSSTLRYHTRQPIFSNFFCYTGG